MQKTVCAIITLVKVTRYNSRNISWFVGAQLAYLLLYSLLKQGIMDSNPHQSGSFLTMSRWILGPLNSNGYVASSAEEVMAI